MTKVLITRREIEVYKQSVLETTVLVRLEEAAVMLAVHPRTVRRMVDEGRLTPYNDGRQRNNQRFLASELRAYVNEMRERMRD